ncbi:MAG: hypothetical protein WCI78_01790 [Mycobacterium sp.]
MKVSQTVAAGVAIALAVAVSAGCGNRSATPTKAPPSTSTSRSSGTATSTPGAAAAPSTSAQPGDYAGLLIQVGDIDAPIPFTAGAPTANPSGQPGVATTFSNDDGSHVIKDTILVLADPSAATDALNAAKGGQADVVKNPTSQPATIGAGGTTLSGNSPDGSKGVTVLLFTEGRAFVTLEFDGPKDMLAPPDFVTGIGQKQDAAIKSGLGTS